MTIEDREKAIVEVVDILDLEVYLIGDIHPDIRRGVLLIEDLETYRDIENRTLTRSTLAKS
jgi:hypothetical protein